MTHTTFDDVEGAIGEAAFCADTTGQPHAVYSAHRHTYTVEPYTPGAPGKRTPLEVCHPIPRSIGKKHRTAANRAWWNSPED